MSSFELLSNFTHILDFELCGISLLFQKKNPFGTSWFAIMFHVRESFRFNTRDQYLQK